MGSLLEKFAGKVDLIYIDPPFATGADFSFETEFGDGEMSIQKEQSIIEEKAYRDTWGARGERYPQWLLERLTLLRDLLSAKGSMYVHVDWHVSHLARCLLDEVFGADRFRNEIAWCYSQGGRPQDAYPNKHDTILFYSKGEQITFRRDDIRIPFELLSEKSSTSFTKTDERGRRYKEIYGPGKKKLYRYYEDEGKVPYDWWTDIPKMTGRTAASKEGEYLGFPTQKPKKLLERIVKASSNPGDLVVDVFCGSGTTLAVAEELQRRWIGCDLGRWAIHVTRKRLLGIENCKPFEVLNLGKYERQYWQGVTFGEAKDKPLTERALYEYLAFILKLYGAQPVAGLTHIHGKKSKAMVHIGAVDAPVTIGEVDAAVDECAKLKQGDLHVLGWEWEMGLYDLMVDAAKKKGVKLLLLQIPHEVMEQQAATKGDVRFFELAYLEAEIKKPKKLTAQVALKDFVIPNTELIPEEVRSKVKKWSDYIDYWAVDWDFQNDTFLQGWVAFRTRKERKLPLASNSHTYEKAGKHRILVKVIDIFGNDTSQAFDVVVN
jgi:DNA modification methylase